MTHRLSIATSDGFELAAAAFGDARACRAGVLIVPAMGVEQNYYASFARHLAESGYFVATFDYRGMGASRPAQFKRSLRGFEADVLTWAERDCTAMVDYMDQSLDGKPLLWIGHSLGGQILALVPNRQRVAAMVTVATGSGYWRENATRLKLVVWWLWFFLVPVVLPLFGYFPGRALKKIGDLPRGVMRQWRSWCLHPEYAVGREGEATRRRFAEVSTPILSLSFTDDEYMSARNTDSLHGFYAGAPRQMMRIAPRDIGERRIGHFGFFRSRFAASLWPCAAQWLAQQATAANAAVRSA